MIVDSGADGRYMYTLARPIYVMNEFGSRNLLCLLVTIRISNSGSEPPDCHSR